ncbi:MAG: tetratricopeptide repeat protein [Caulobacteraceae bacterium]
MADDHDEHDHASHDRRRSDRSRSDNSFGVAAGLAALLAVLLIGGALLTSWWPFGGAGGDFNLFGKGANRGGACERPQYVELRQPGFGEQETQIRALRKRAFRGDFFSQLDLAERYRGDTPADKKLKDPIEAAVWYALALANPDGYSPTSARESSSFFSKTRASLFDDCRAHERNRGYRQLDRLLSDMTSKERDKVRDRITYVLYTQGSEGMRVLARLHDARGGPFGEPSDNGEAAWAWGRRHSPATPMAVQLFERNDVDAYMYDYLAHQDGDVGAYVIMKEFRSGRRGDLEDVAKSKAQAWVPPYEFYPPEAPDSGVPHSDESRLHEAWELALDNCDKLPFRHISRALKYLGVSHRVVDSERQLGEQEAGTFQAMLGRPITGRLTPIEKVRAIQYAAVNGSPDAQLVLAVMYSEGVGVPMDYARAFYWYSEADRQGSPEAKFAISNFFSLGVEGVADQDKAKAVVYQLEAALSGYKPSVRRLQELLRHVDGRRRRGHASGRHNDASYDYGPPQAEGFPPYQGDGYGQPDGNGPPEGDRPQAPSAPGSQQGGAYAAPDDTAATGDTRNGAYQGAAR